ncbi:MAG: SDR family oxidoreductase [Verrucomicrobiota bacterium]|nr:SDR family oxidoreductase [Verrucomicrobiota bacterium]
MSERVAVITGGGGDLADEMAPALRALGIEVHAPGRDLLDVTSSESARAFFAELERIDLLINNAGTRRDVLCAKMTEEDWDAVQNVNLRGAFLCSQAASLKMIKQRSGHIINIGSFSARFGNFGQTNYAAAKAGLIGLTQSLARELGKRNVRVNCVLPGFLETKFTSNVPADAKERIRRTHELGRFNTTEAAARFVAFLDTMPFVSGQIFQLDSRIAPWT